MVLRSAKFRYLRLAGESRAGVGFRGFEPQLFQFLEELADNNNRPWFQKNKGRYQREVLEPAMAFIRAFQPRLKRISPSFLASDRRVGGSLQRVYRDTRFFKDGEPYKTNVGIQFRHEQGRDVHAPGFYVHIAPGECFLAVGLWRPEPGGSARSGRRSSSGPTVATGTQQSEVPRAIFAGRRQPETPASRLSGRSSLDRGSQADGLHRPRRVGGAGRSRQGVPGPRCDLLHRQSSLHAFPVRCPQSAFLKTADPCRLPGCPTAKWPPWYISPGIDLFCRNFDISWAGHGRPVTPEQLAGLLLLYAILFGPDPEAAKAYRPSRSAVRRGKLTGLRRCRDHRHEVAPERYGYRCSGCRQRRGCRPAHVPPIPFEKYTLPNGLQVILHEDHYDADRHGEHMVSCRREKRAAGPDRLRPPLRAHDVPRFAASDRNILVPLQRVGGRLNGSTSQDRTNYWETVPANYLEMALWMESDRMGFLLPAMTRAKLDNQRDVVKNERRQSYDNRPYGLALRDGLGSHVSAGRTL